MVARPKSKTSKTTAQQPLTTPNAPTNSERQNPPQEGISDSNPPPTQKYPNLHWHPMEWSRKDVRKSLWVEEGLADPSYYYFEIPPIKIESQTQEQATSSTTAAPKAEKCGWGPYCSICKNIEEDWHGDYQKQFQQNVPMYTTTVTPDARSSVLTGPQGSKAPKLPVLPVTNIWCTWQTLQPIKAL